MNKRYIGILSYFVSGLSFFHIFSSVGNTQDINLGSANISISGESGSVLLDQYFRSSSDGTQSLRYEIVSSNDPNRTLSNTAISNSTLSLRSGTQSGTATLVVRALPLKPFPVLDNINIPENPFPTKPGAPVRYTVTAGMTPSQILTHYAFFTYDQNTKTYDLTRLNEEQLRRVIKNHVNSIDPLVLDIETYEYFGNDQVGRDNLARVLTIIREERPDVKLLGYYLLLPMRAWYESINLRRAERDKALGLSTWYATNHPKFIEEYNNWVNKNSLYRTSTVSSFAGGGTVAQKISAVYPSLYTLKIDNEGEDLETTYDQNSNFFTAKSCGFQNGNEVRLTPSNAATLPSPLSRWNSYYIVNSSSDNLRFQVSDSPGGTPIKLASSLASRTYIRRMNAGRTLCQDKDVVDWITYARDNIAEARKYGVPVYPYISPTFRGAGGSEIDASFFRMQLETLRDLADGVVIWDPSYESQASRTSRAWWKEMSIFLAAQKPRTITLNINVSVPKPATPIAQGDVNGDSLVNGDDYVACATRAITAGCDLNNNGSYDVNDAIQFLRIISIATMPGDINRDGKLSQSDVTTCQGHLAQSVSSVNNACDFNRDNTINSSDISLISANIGRIFGDFDNSKNVDSSDLIVCFSNYTGGVKSNVRYEQCDVDGDKDVDNLDITSVMAAAYRGCGSASGTCSASAEVTARSKASLSKATSFTKKDLRNKRTLKKFIGKVNKLKTPIKGLR